MNVQRAKEISESAEQANVSFQGMPVMIQHVDENSETARIYDAANPERELTVPVKSLEER
ncbi:H-type small acid-soluble spore protein [Bacillus cytotoxicus]|uniref:Small, acid-soluble spore protein H 2 n=2 Tax=Bacillus cytotoxicus TaxID=580165 RepID=SSPH2_BACCN|nr:MULTISPECIES: H-type small acid-soluble spore protein [Bacillus cereus group]A7GNL0.1 RecName: Full=Small, acid-soluble spore protein H 2; Short=SASP H 2 [Bacillus cytotoxicus NVH 391-98]ABS21718.1 small acid-soluble spore H family protein [Bacillus cytotoxicus NVH 391-98]AWC28333.1 H-type small acid-soluble spore protein [Bacillus cytotoxicus]AWC32365.1 H-type small acid-soluble spore protein [Bacillus cytotoxicus]AWC36394.1 H-type small acid-soluble spore protein [Bacillus cytotoxicus]AW